MRPDSTRPETDDTARIVARGVCVAVALETGFILWQR